MVCCCVSDPLIDMAMDQNTFAELLLFIRNHPDQRRQLRRALLHTDVQEPTPTLQPKMVSAKEAAERYGMAHTMVAAFAREQGVMVLTTPDHRTMLDEAHLEQAVRRHYENGYMTAKDAAWVADCTLGYLNNGNQRGYWMTRNGWVLRQELLEHYLLTANAAKRAAIVQRMEELEARVLDQPPHEAVVITLPREAAPREVVEQLALGL